MVKILNPNIFQFLGVICNGDFGPFTIYTSRRKKLIIFLKTWPKDPATYNQLLNRNRWRHAGIRWRALPAATRRQWFELARKSNATVTGFNLFMYYILGNHNRPIETLERQTGVNVIALTGDPLPFLDK